MKNILAVLLALAGFAAGVYSVKALIERRTRVDQPIQYTHALHAGKLKMPCLACHQKVMTGTRASIPNIEVCSACHATPLKNTPGEQLVYQYVKDHKPIPWQSIYVIPEHALFSHRRHAGIAKLDCALCHGDMTLLDKPPTTQFLQVKMDNCLTCHRERKASTDCAHCHR